MRWVAAVGPFAAWTLQNVYNFLTSGLAFSPAKLVMEERKAEVGEGNVLGRREDKGAVHIPLVQTA